MRLVRLGLIGLMNFGHGNLIDMQHKWKDNTCKTCGCKREKSGYRRGDIVRTWYVYERSNIFFGEKMPECLDWNDNSLD